MKKGQRKQRFPLTKSVYNKLERAAYNGQIYALPPELELEFSRAFHNENYKFAPEPEGT